MMQPSDRFVGHHPGKPAATGQCPEATCTGIESISTTMAADNGWTTRAPPLPSRLGHLESDSSLLADLAANRGTAKISLKGTAAVLDRHTNGIRLVSLIDGKSAVLTLRPHAWKGGAFSQDGRLFAAAVTSTDTSLPHSSLSHRGKIEFYQTHPPANLATLKFDHPLDIRSIAWSHDNHWVAAGLNNHTVRLLDLNDGELSSLKMKSPPDSPP